MAKKGTSFTNESARRIGNTVRAYEATGAVGSQYRRRGVSGGILPANPQIAQVASNSTGGGVYNCDFYQVLEAAWDTATTSYLTRVDVKADTIKVLNIHEIPIAGDTASHILSRGDYILCWPSADNAGNVIYVGFAALRYKDDCD